LTAQWALQREADPTFASGVGTATFDMNADFKIREHFRAGKFNPFSKELTEDAYNDRLKYAIYVLGRYFLCRGRNEIAFCNWEQVRFHETVVNGEKEEYVELIHKWDKTHQMNLNNTTSRDVNSRIAPRIYENANDELCPHRFLKFLRGLCVPEQERILCQAGNKAMLKNYRAGKGPYIYNPKLPVGANTVGPLCQEMALEMGFDMWEKCTGHGLRKMGITNAMTYAETNIAPVVLGASRHKNYQTSLAYQKPNDDMYRSYNKAMLGRHVPSPPKRSRSKRRKKVVESNEDEDIISSEDNVVEMNNNNVEDAKEKELATISISETMTVLKEADNVSSITNYKSDTAEAADSCSGNSNISGTISSLSGLVSEGDHIHPSRAMALIPQQQFPNTTISAVHPHYNMQSNHIQRNIILNPTPGGVIQPFLNMPHPYAYESEISRQFEERKEWENKVKDLQLQLAYQKERFDDIKKDLREVKKKGKKENQQVTISTCLIL